MMLGQDDPVSPPHPTPNFISSDFGNSHDLAGLLLGGMCTPSSVRYCFIEQLRWYLEMVLIPWIAERFWLCTHVQLRLYAARWRRYRKLGCGQ